MYELRKFLKTFKAFTIALNSNRQLHFAKSHRTNESFGLLMAI